MNNGFDIIFGKAGIDRMEVGFDDIYRIDMLTGAVDTNIASAYGFDYWMGPNADGQVTTHAELNVPGLDNMRFYTEALDPRYCMHV